MLTPPGTTREMPSLDVISLDDDEQDEGMAEEEREEREKAMLDIR